MPCVPKTKSCLNGLGDSGNREDRRRVSTHSAPPTPKLPGVRGRGPLTATTGSVAACSEGPPRCPQPPTSSQAPSGVVLPVFSQWGQKQGIPWVSELPYGDLGPCGPQGLSILAQLTAGFWAQRRRSVNAHGIEGRSRGERAAVSPITLLYPAWPQGPRDGEPQRSLRAQP